jgi:diketogulonate reductase-like aldo/keto reductase
MGAPCRAPKEHETMKHVSLPGGEKVPALGLGTWRMGESARTRAAEVAAVREAIGMGYRLIDTAEMYGEGGAESVVGEALRGAVQAGDVRREELFIVSKVYPHNASRAGTVAACERSLARLGLDHIDLYLLHWRGSHPLRDTVEGFEALRAGQRIRHWGVSNCDVDDLQELWSVSGACAANQVWYSMSQRGAEFDLLPWQRERGVPLMAYSPIDQAELARNIMLAELGLRRGITAAQLALAWTLRDGGVIAIPKAVKTEHLRANLAAADVQLDRETLAAIDTAFPPPKRRQPLAVN